MRSIEDEKLEGRVMLLLTNMLNLFSISKIFVYIYDQRKKKSCDTLVQNHKPQRSHDDN